MIFEKYPSGWSIEATCIGQSDLILFGRDASLEQRRVEVSACSKKSAVEKSVVF